MSSCWKSMPRPERCVFRCALSPRSPMAMSSLSAGPVRAEETVSAGLLATGAEESVAIVSTEASVENAGEAPADAVAADPARMYPLPR